MKKEKLTKEQKQEAKRDKSIFINLVYRAKLKGALITD